MHDITPRKDSENTPPVVPPPSVPPLPRFDDAPDAAGVDNDESGVWQYGRVGTGPHSASAIMDIDKDTILTRVDEFMDTAVSLGIRVGRLDEALARELHTLTLSWREFTLHAAGISDDGLDRLARRTDA